MENSETHQTVLANQSSLSEDMIRNMTEYQAMNLLSRYGISGVRHGRHSAEFTKKKRTAEQRKARRKMQAASRKANRGTMKGQRCHKGKKYSVM